MARNSRQNKIVELISSSEIETQGELVDALRKLEFDITQATISRDIKELGLIKVLTPDGKKYKYALNDTGSTIASPRFASVLKDIVTSIRFSGTNIVVKTMRGAGSLAAECIEKMNIEGLLGTVAGNDSVLLISENEGSTFGIVEKINQSLE